MKSMHELKEMLCEELEMIAKKGAVSHTDLENVYKLTESVKNIMKIDEMGEGGTSSAPYHRNYSSYDNGSYGRGCEWRANGSYADGDMSGRGRHYVRGHYSYADDERSMLSQRLEEMMESSGMSLDDKSIMHKALEILRR